jgi:hypothetical protein
MDDPRHDIPGTEGNGEHSSVWELVKDLRDDALRLLRDEARLVRLEAKDELNQIASDYARLTFAFVMVQAGFVVLLLGVSDLIQLAIQRTGGWSGAVTPLIVGIVSTAGGGLWMYRRLKTIKHNRMRMDKTAQSWRKNVAWLQRSQTQNDRWSEQ